MQEATAIAFDVASLGSTLTGAVTAKDVLTLIGACVGAGIPLALAWFGARKAIRAFSGALKKGKISV